MLTSSQICFFKVLLGELILEGEGEEGAEEEEGEEVPFTSLTYNNRVPTVQYTQPN